ncbi:unnamed protein product [Closterium sp. NIES-54]
MRMAGVHYSTTSYLTHIIKGLTGSYNLLKRLSLAPSTRAALNEDSLTSYILQDEAMQEAERPSELLAQSGGGGSSGWKPTKDADKKKSAKDSSRGGGSRRWECWLCCDPDHLSFECPDRSDSDDDDAKGGRGRSSSRRPRRGKNQRRKEKQLTKSSTLVKDADSSASAKGRDNKEASCSLVGVVELTVSLAPEAGEDFQAMAAAVQANPVVVLLDSGCSHHLMGTKEVFVDLQLSGNVKHVRDFNGALQDVQGRGTNSLQGEAGRQVLIPDVLYVPGVRANLLLAGQLKENGMKVQEDGDGMLLVSTAGDVLGWASYTGASPLHRPASLLAEVDNPHDGGRGPAGDCLARQSTRSPLGWTSSRRWAPTCRVSCVGGKLARHTFPEQGSDANDVLAVVHVDLCGPFRVAAKDGSLYFLLLKDHKTRYVWVRPVAKKSDALQEFEQWLAVTERQTKKSVLMLGSGRGGEFLGNQFTDFVNGKGIVHDLTCPYTPQQNSMAKREMRTVVESVRTMLLHMGVQHHWWHLALRQAIWVRNYLERSTLQPGTTPYQLLTGKKPDLSLARVVTTSDVVFYENMSLEVWKSEQGPASSQTPTTLPADTSTATLPLLAEVGEPAAENVEDVPYPFPSPAPCAPPLVADLHGLTPVSASGDEGRSETSPSAPTKSIAGGRRDKQQVDVGVKSALIGEEQAEEVQPTLEKSAKKALAGQQPTGEQAAVKPTKKQSATRQSAEETTTGEKSAGKSAEVQQDDEGNEAGDDGGDAKESTDSDVVEVQRGPQQSGRIWRPPNFYVPAAFTTVYDEVDDDLQYDDAKEDEDFPELDPDMHADPEHRLDISTMTVKKALASWKGKAVNATMEEEIRSLVGMGTWELVERPPGVNIMKNRWVLTTKYHIDNTVEREKARLVVKGFTQVYGADYDETYAPVSSYVTLRIFLSIVAVLDLNLMQLDMKNAFLQRKLDRVLYMYQADYFNDGTGRVCKVLKSLYGLKQSPLLWYMALDGVLMGAGWKKSQVDTALYFKVGDDKVTCWVLVYVEDLLTASSSAAMLKELNELLKAAFELREISSVQKYLRLEIVRDRSVRKLWLHQHGYDNKLRRRFLNEKQNRRTPKTPVSIDAYATVTFDDEEAQVRQEERYRQKVGSLQFAATTTRPNIAFACSKLGSSLTVRSDQHWHEVDRCLAYLANTRDTALEFDDGAESLKLVAYVDADYAGDKQNRTSTSGYVFVFGGAAVSWSSRHIKCAMLSSTESEYVAATEAGKEGHHLRFLLAKFRQLDAGTPTVLRVDNKLAITVAEGMGLTGNLKHMERRQAWLQHMVTRGKFSLRYIPTAEQPADFLTKALHYPAFNRCSVSIGHVRLVDMGDGDNDVQ